MKKYIAIFLFTLFAFTTVACGSGTSTGSSSNSASGSVGKFTGGSETYTLKDGKIYYQEDTEVEGANPNDFKVIIDGAKGTYDYAISSTAVFRGYEKYEGVSPKGFVVLNPGYDIYKNNDHVYVGDEIAEGLDPITYKLISDEKNGLFGVDKNGVYSNVSEKWAAVVDPATFELIPSTTMNTYAKDSKNVYMDGGIVEGADPKTFDPMKQ